MYTVCIYLYRYIWQYIWSRSPVPPPPQCDDSVHTTHCSNDYMAAALLLWRWVGLPTLDHMCVFLIFAVLWPHDGITASLFNLPDIQVPRIIRAPSHHRNSFVAGREKRWPEGLPFRFDGGVNRNDLLCRWRRLSSYRNHSTNTGESTIELWNYIYNIVQMILSDIAHGQLLYIYIHTHTPIYAFCVSTCTGGSGSLSIR